MNEKEGLSALTLILDHVKRLQENKTLCAICFENEKETLFLPCGHFSCCSDCAIKVTKETNCCPICRKAINVVHPVYHS